MHSLRTRVTFIHNSEAKTTGTVSTLISTLLHADSLSDVSPSRILEALANGSDTHHAPGAQQPFTLTGEEASSASITRLLQASRLVTRQLGLQPGQRAVLINGRVRHSVSHCMRWALSTSS